MRTVLSVLLGVVAAGSLSAQEATVVSERVAQTTPPRWIEPGSGCELKKGNYLVSSGSTYLKSGTETGVDENKHRLFGDAKRVLTEAILEKGQEKNAAAWYYLGRAYLALGDIGGLDSAFARAEALAPECRDDIGFYRRGAWVALVNPGVEFLQADNVDSALALFRLANQVFHDAPNALYNTAVIHANAQRPDSAIVYFRKAATTAAKDSTKFKDDRNQATFNLAVILQNQGRHQEALEAFSQYVRWVPDDTNGRRGLAISLRAVGKADSAAVIEKAIVSSAGEDVSTNDLMSLGISFFRDQKYAESAKAFAQVVEREPYNRDAVFNLANAHLGASDGKGLIAAGTKLLVLDPMNESSIKLLAQGHQMEKDTETTIKLYTDLEALPVSVTVDTFLVNDAGARLTGTVTGRQARTADGRPIKAVAVTLVFELVDSTGAAVATKEFALPVLAKDATRQIRLEAATPSAVGWRYRRK